MIVYSFLSITLLLAILSWRLLYRGVSGRHWPRLFTGLALVAFTYHYGAWIFISAYGRYVYLGLSLLLWVLAWLRRSPQGNSARRRHIGYHLASLVFFVLVLLYYTGIKGRTQYADLGFPLKQDRYFVFQGGKGLPSNIFHFNSRRAVYAMDIVRLDSYGRRANKIFSKELSDYYIFGDTVYSPCDGLVGRAVDDNPDNIPPVRKRGPHNLNGVLIAGTAYDVYMGHLQQYRVFVKAGQRVSRGQALGLVGNSGMSIEPHLHIQVHKKSTDGSPWYRQPQLYMRFNGDVYLLFDIIPIRT